MGIFGMELGWIRIDGTRYIDYKVAKEIILINRILSISKSTKMSTNGYLKSRFPNL